MWFINKSGSPARPFYVSASWLGIALVSCKAALLGTPSIASVDSIIEYGRDLAIMSHADVLFAVTIGLLGGMMIRLQPKWPASRPLVVIAMLVFCVLSVIYAIANVQVFAYLRSYLTYPLIYVAGDLKNMRSSLGAFLTPGLIAILVSAPLCYLWAVWMTPRFIASSAIITGIAGRAGRAGALCVLAAYVGYGYVGYNSMPWLDRVDRRVAENPHWVLARSLLTDVFSPGRPALLREQFPPNCLDDFMIGSERAEAIEMGRDRSLPPLNLASTLTDAAYGMVTPPSSSVELTAGIPRRRPMNVIVYVLESVGVQHLSLYGSPYDTTPCLNRAAANALVFDNFYAHCGVTANSLVAINLGIYPGLTWREYTVEQPNLPGTTVAQLLHARNYRTAYMTSGEIQYVNMDGFLKNRGYDRVWGYEHLGCGALLDSWGVEDRCLVDSVLEWVDQDRERPFYAMVWTQQTHHPYEPSPSVPFIDFFREFERDQLPPDHYDLGRYLNVLHEADRQLGRLFSELERRGLADDTLVIVTGDHGEGFGSPHDIYGHGGRVFDEIVKVPLVAWNRRLFDGGERVATIGGHIDLNPTLAEWLDLPCAESWQGRSLFDAARSPRAYFFAANDDYLLGVRDREFKYIFNATTAREQLFDLGRDPKELTSLADQQSDLCEQLRQRIAAWVHYEQGHIAKLRDGRSR